MRCARWRHDHVSLIESPVAVSTLPPDFLTLEEAAAVLRIGRSTAYQRGERVRGLRRQDRYPVMIDGQVPAYGRDPRDAGDDLVRRVGCGNCEVLHAVFDAGAG